MNNMQELDGYARCPQCGTSYMGCVGVYHCFECEAPNENDNCNSHVEIYYDYRYSMRNVR